MNMPIIDKAPTAAIKIQSIFRVGAANPLLMFPNPESGRRAKNVLLISHEPMNQRQQDTKDSTSTAAKQQQN
jgi:hypothetical protein